MKFDPRRVRSNAQQSSSEDLMDRMTIWRDDLEPTAVEVLAAELFRRGIGPDQIDAHRQKREEAGIERVDGIALQCSLCERPACERRWGWHWLRGYFPVSPRRFAYCVEHRAGKNAKPGAAESRD